MLVKLTSSTSGEMIMFAEQVRRLYEIIDKECTARGVFTKEQVPEALAKLHHAVHAEKMALHAARHEASEDDIDDADETPDDEDYKTGRVVVNLAQRATPLIHLMERTQKEAGFILWEADKDF